KGGAWSIPITLRVSADEAARVKDGQQVALYYPDGALAGVLELSGRYRTDKQHEAEQVFRTTEDAHPGVARLYRQGDVVLAGDVRMKGYRIRLDNYYPKDRVVLAIFPAAMRYGGPREAVFHAVCRRNYGCTHFIVGRDHAGVGNYYGTYDAQKLIDEFAPEEL